MNGSRGTFGLLATLLVLVVVFLAWREAGKFERISGVAHTQPEATEPTLRGKAMEPVAAPEADLVSEPDPDAGAAEAASGSWEVWGRVVDLAHRTVAGVPVRIGPVETTSGADGRFAARVVGASAHVIPGADWNGMAVATPQEPEVVLQVSRLLPLRIRVLDAAGRPLAGVTGTGRSAWVRRTDGTGGQTWEAVSLPWGPTDADGWFATRLPASTNELQLEVSHAGVFAKEQVPFPFQREVVLRLGLRLAIRGHVFDATGAQLDPVGVLVARPLDPTQATIRSHDEIFLVEEEFAYHVETDGAPEQPVEDEIEPFHLGVSGPGPWLVHIEPVEPGLAASAPALVTAPANDVRLVCPRAVSIHGRILDTGGTLFTVWWIPAPAPSGYGAEAFSIPSNADGTFELGGLAPGAGRIFVRSAADDRYGLVEGVEAPLEGLEVRLQQAAPLVGRVTDYAPPAGAEDATLWVQAVDGGLSGGAPVETSGPLPEPGARGTFRIRGLPPGRYALQWCWFGRWGVTSEPWVPFGVTVDLGPETDEVVLPCPGGVR